MNQESYAQFNLGTSTERRCSYRQVHRGLAVLFRRFARTSGIGGVLGVLSGVMVAETVTLIIGMPSSIKLWAVAAGLLVAASVGVFFGVYPARKAARLDPIVALRFEM